MSLGDHVCGDFVILISDVRLDASARLSRQVDRMRWRSTIEQMVIVLMLFNGERELEKNVDSQLITHFFLLSLCVRRRRSRFVMMMKFSFYSIFYVPRRCRETK